MKTRLTSRGSVLALCGGIGGAKLALGLYHVLPPGALTIVVNTGDDFEHLGLHISPDIDTVAYTLAGLSDTHKGWGRADETWSFMRALEALGGEIWFRLGDKDLATHVERTRRLRLGEKLSTITADFAGHWGIDARIVPMSDDPVRTMVYTAEGVLSFQDYFVRQACRPAVTAIAFDGGAQARCCAGVLSALGDADLRAVVICPSNPYLSVDPILAVPGIRSALERSPVPKVAVSPLVGGRAVKGPTVKIMGELGVPATVSAVAEHYRGLIDGLVVDEADLDAVAGLDLACRVGRTVMTDLEDRMQLADLVLAFADALDERHARPLRPAERLHGL